MISGALSEDPNFPKIQWPPPELCPTCHSLSDNMDHKWNYNEVLSFLMSYFSSERILTGAHPLMKHPRSALLLSHMRSEAFKLELFFCRRPVRLPGRSQPGTGEAEGETDAASR